MAKQSKKARVRRREVRRQMEIKRRRQGRLITFGAIVVVALITGGLPGSSLGADACMRPSQMLFVRVSVLLGLRRAPRNPSKRGPATNQEFSTERVSGRYGSFDRRRPALESVLHYRDPKPWAQKERR